MPLSEDGVGQGQAFNASLVNVQEKKVSEHQMGKQVVHSLLGAIPTMFLGIS